MGYAFAVLSMFLYGVCPTVFPRVIGLPGPLLTTLATIFAACLCTMALGGRAHAEALEVTRAHPGRMLLFGGATALCMLTFQWAVQFTTFANVIIVSAIHPMITCLFALPAFAGRPRPTWRGYFALALGLAGMAVYLWPQLSLGTASLAGLALALAHAAGFTLYDVQMDVLKRKASPEALLLASLWIGAVALSPVLVAYDFSGVTRASFGLILLFAALNAFGANLLYLCAARRIPTGHVSTLAYLMAPFGIAAGWLGFGERLTPFAAVGALLVLVSAALVVRDKPGAQPI
jgi:drug/metabolite transporter (DMT)-like permease